MEDFSMVDYVHKLVNMPKLCEICGTEINDQNQSEKYEYGCKDCDHEKYEKKLEGKRC